MTTPGILTVASQKGGVGKTTVALNLSFSLACRGTRVLLVDADPQGAIGASIQGTPEGPGLRGVLRGEVELGKATLATQLAAFSILPFGPSEPETRGAGKPLPGEQIGEVLAAADFDVVVVDTASGLCGPTLELLAASGHLLLPLQAEPLALRTLLQVLDALGSLREQGRSPALAGVVLTMLDTRNDASLGVAQETWRTLPPALVLETVVPRDPTFLAASAAGVPVALLSRRPPPAAAVFDQLAAELEPRLGRAPGAQDEPIPLLV